MNYFKQKLEIVFVAKSEEDFENAQKALIPIREEIRSHRGYVLIDGFESFYKYEANFHKEETLGSLTYHERFYNHCISFADVFPKYLKAITPYIEKADVIYDTYPDGSRNTYAFNMNNNGKWIQTMGHNEDPVPAYAMSLFIKMKDNEDEIKIKSTSVEIANIFKGIAVLNNLEVNKNSLHFSFTPKATLKKSEIMDVLKKLTPYIKGGGENYNFIIQNSSDFSATNYIYKDLGDGEIDWFEQKGKLQFLENKEPLISLFNIDGLTDKLNADLNLDKEDEEEIDLD